MKIILHTLKNFFSKFLHLRRMEENFQLLDYTKFDPQKTIIFDVDLTICVAKNRDYENAEPISAVIEKINRLHSEGWTIVLLTARGQLSKNGDMKKIEMQNRPVLERWLKKNNVSYDYLIFTKPYGMWYVDDKGLDLQGFLSKEF